MENFVDDVMGGLEGGNNVSNVPIQDAVDAGSHASNMVAGSWKYHQALNNMDNLSNSAEHNLRLAKARKERTRVQNFVADVCGVDPDKKMTKLNTLGSVVWMSAKFAAISVIFGPIVGGWMLAHMTNHDYYAKKEAKYIDLANSLLFDNILMSPFHKDHAGKFSHLSPRQKAASDAEKGK